MSEIQNLDHTIAEWRQTYEGQRRYSTQDIDELESHLRDEIAFRIDEGMSERDAFREAISEVGEAWSGEVEYRKVYWGKLLQPSRLLEELGWSLGLVAANLKSARSNLARHRSYTLTNLAGLTIAITGCLLVLLYVRSELSRGTSYPKTDRIYRVVSWTLDEDGERRYNRGSDGRIGPALRDNFPEIEQILRSQTEWPMRVRAGEKVLQQQAISVMDPAVVSMLDLSFLAGSRERALATPDGAVLRESTAKALFGDENPIGKTVSLASHWGGDYTVTGVVPEPEWTVFALNFSFLTTRRTHNASGWERVLMGSSWRPIQTFVLLREGADAERLSTRLDAMNVLVNGEEWEGRSGYALQPLARIHLYGNQDYPGIFATGNIDTVYALSATAVMVLLIACFNFVNLTTARFAQRTREIGIRKAAGAGRLQLVSQFLSESLLLAVLAGLASVLAAEALQPTFAEYVERGQIDMSSTTTTWLMLVALVLSVGILAGLYPAIVTTRLRPGLALSGDRPETGGFGTRRFLVALQFVISAVLVISTLIVHEQIDFLEHRDIGIDRTNVIWTSLGSKRVSELGREEVTRAFRQHPNVIETAFTGRVPVFEYREKVAAEGHPEQRSMLVLEGDEDFVDLLKIDVLAGRNFSRQHPTDAADAVILTEEAVRRFGWEIGSSDPEKDPIGKRFEQFRFRRTGQVVGVVNDIKRLRASTEPVFIRMRNSGMGNILVKMHSHDIPETMAFLKQTSQTLVPGKPFSYRFLDGAVEHVFRVERQVSSMATAFFVLAIGIACLGLFALAAFTAEQRTKELGIRKAVGATSADLFALLTRGFMLPVLAATLVGWPVAYLLAERWLADYVHRIELNTHPFAIGTICALMAAFLAVGYRTLRAARANPVDALRYE
jgi:putative ABC transport system permease protein